MCHFTSNDSGEACADPGATDVMLSDVGASISYQSCTNRSAILGDETPLPMFGEGAANFSLSGKILVIQNCIHDPGLRSPVYLLRIHTEIPVHGASRFYDV